MLIREDGGESLADFASLDFMSCEGLKDLHVNWLFGLVA